MIIIPPQKNLIVLYTPIRYLRLLSSKTTHTHTQKQYSFSRFLSPTLNKIKFN